MFQPASTARRAPWSPWMAIGLAAVGGWFVFVYANAYPHLGSILRSAVFPHWPHRFVPNLAWAAPPAALVLLAAAWASGRRLLGCLKLASLSSAEADLLAAPIGLYLLSLANFVLACAHWMARPAMLSVIGAALLWGRREVAAALRRLRAHRSAGWPPVLAIVALGLTGLFAVLALACALAPELSTDALHLHLNVVIYYLKKAGFAQIPDYSYMHLPESAHLVFAPLYDLLGDAGPRALVWCETLWLLALIGWTAAHWFGSRAGVLAPLIALSTPVVLASATVAMTDVPLTLLAVAGLLVALHHGGERRGALLVGALLGAAAATKYSGITYLLIGGTLAALAARDRASPLREVLVTALVVWLTGAVVAAPFYLRNWDLTGSPLFPALPSLFPSRVLRPDEQQAIMGAFYNQHGVGRGLKSLLLLPWNMTVHGEQFGGALGGFFLAALALVPPALGNSRLRRLLLATGLCFGAFAIAQHAQRYFLPGLYLLILFLVGARDRLPSLGRAGRIAAGGFVAAALATAVIHLPFFHRSWLRGWFYYEPSEIPLAVAAGEESREAFLARRVPVHPLIRRFMESAQPDSRVLFSNPWEPDGAPAWFAGRLIQSFYGDRALAVLGVAEPNGPTAVAAALREVGATHVLVRRDRDHATVFDEDSAFANSYLQRIDAASSFALYEVRPHTGPVVAADLIARFVRAPPATAIDSGPFLLAFARAGGEERQAIIVPTGAPLRFPLQVPEGAWLETSLAMPWNAGDGAIAQLDFVEDARSTRLLALPLKPVPARTELDPGWRPVRVDLGSLAGRTGRLVFSTDPGPAGDTTADLIGWADPRVLVRRAPEKVAIELLDRLPEAVVTPPRYGFPQVQRTAIERGGERREAIAISRSAEARLAIEIPTGRPRFEAWVTSSGASGGTVARIRFVENDFATELLRLSLQPARTAPGAGGWTPVVLDLAPFAGHRGELVLSTDPGSAGKERPDWIGWADVRVVATGAPGVVGAR